MTEATEIFGYVGDGRIGRCVEVIRSSGSILTVPVLVCPALRSCSQATGYSLVAVGISALVASITYLWALAGSYWLWESTLSPENSYWRN
jgi:hypothetical protein